jgi:hypothetical protein
MLYWQCYHAVLHSSAQPRDHSAKRQISLQRERSTGHMAAAKAHISAHLMPIRYAFRPMNVISLRHEAAQWLQAVGMV